MKRKLWIAAALALLMAGLCLCAAAAEPGGNCGDSVTWQLESSTGILRISGSGPMWDFDEENPGWYDQADAITSVVIEEGVTSVGDFAFYFLPMGSSHIAHVALPQSLTDIGQYAFGGCSSLTELDIPYSVTVIRSGALYRCDGLADENGFIIFRNTLYGYTGSAEHVTIPARITEISGSAFKDCLFMTGVTFPSGLNNIREYAFDNCALLASVTFPASLASIQNHAFCFCSGLEKVEFPESLIFLGESAFHCCASLREAFFYNPETYFSRAPFTECEDLTLFGFSSSTAQAHAQSHDIWFKPLDGACGDNVTWTLVRGTLTISGTGPMWSDYSNEPSWTIQGHGRRITSVVIEDGVTSICPYAFYFEPAPNLITRISIPQSVTTIEDYAFGACSSLTSLNIPDTVTVMGSGVLFKCYGLADENGFIIFRNVLYGYAGTASKITVPAGITAISGSAFLDNVSLTDISLPDSLNTIQDRAFYNCSALSSITLPAHLTSIQRTAFEECTSLNSVTIPESVIFIGTWAFLGCTNLTEAVILNPDAVIASDAFNRCPSLSLCGMLPSTAKDFADGHSIPFTAIGGPCGDDVTWAWNRDTGVVTFSGTGPMWDYTWEDHSPLYYHSGMTTAVIGKDVTSVGAFLFHGCKKLAFVSIPDSVDRIGNAAFIYCSALDNVTIPEGVTSIRSLFQSCTSLTHVTLPQSLTAIEQSAFYGCTGLTGLDFVPDTVTVIRDQAFYGCTGLTDVTVPRGISAIGYCVFQNCTNLTSVTVHRGIQRIDRYAFDGDTDLANVYYEGVRSEWDAIVIDPDHNDPLLSAALHCRFAVTFDTVGGYPDIPMQAVEPEGLPTEPAAPRKIGAVFAGWYTDATYSDRYNFLIPVTADLTLYASWAYPAPAGLLKLPADMTAIEEQAFFGVGAEGVILRDTVSDISGSAFDGSQIHYIFGFEGSEADAFAQSHPSFVFVPIDQNWLSTH